MNITALNKADVFLTLFNNAKTPGLGLIAAAMFGPLSIEGAEKIMQDCNEDIYFDYVYGRVMKISLKGDDIDTRLYNLNNGENAAEKAIQKLRENIKNDQIDQKKELIKNNLLNDFKYSFINN